MEVLLLTMVCQLQATEYEGATITPGVFPIDALNLKEAAYLNGSTGSPVTQNFTAVHNYGPPSKLTSQQASAVYLSYLQRIAYYIEDLALTYQSGCLPAQTG